MRGLVVAGTASGVGKTVATLALCHGLRRVGHTVQPAKAGPDFIDPTHHAVVCGRSSRTLDPWLQGVDGMRRNYARGEGDVCVVEGMMGLYDGDVSTARVAAGLDLPVVLVVDASAGMESVAATALGFQRYAADSAAAADVDVVGVIAARAHAGRHEAGIRDALPDGLAYLGRTPPREDLTVPDRHLGLHLGTEAPLPDAALDAAADSLAVDRLFDLAHTPPWLPVDPAPVTSTRSTDADTPPRVAVAHDDAFCFVYPATLERLHERATVVTFSPVAGDGLPPCDGVYLPGGYPERFVTAFEPTLDDVAAAAVDGVPVWGECGGLLVLAETLTVDDTTHEMAGVLPADVRMTDGLAALDHVELVAERDTLTAPAGATRRGHEYHHSTADVATDARFAFDVERGTGIDGRDGLVAYETLGTYAHCHAASGVVDRFLDAVDGAR